MLFSTMVTRMAIQIFCLLVFIRSHHATSVPSESPTLSPTSLNTSVWIPDDIAIMSSLRRNVLTNESSEGYVGQWLLDVSVTTNGPLYASDGGHFRLNISIFELYGNEYQGISDCIPGNTGVKDMTNIISKIVVEEATMKTVGSIFSLYTKKYFNNGSTNIWTFETVLNSNNIGSLSVNVLMSDCAIPRTVGFWNDPTRWNTGLIPSSESNVYIPAGSGVIVIENDVVMTSMETYGGLIIAHDSPCPPGWSVDPQGYRDSGLKCYKLYENSTDFYSAEATCANIGRDTRGAHLMQLRDREELHSAMRLCRGLSGSPANQFGCWIGLHDPQGTGDFDWIEPLTSGSAKLFVDWRRGEANNHTISAGVLAPLGERCGVLVPWQEDPLIEEQGSWNDISCDLSRAFVCQMYMTTDRFSITVLSHSAFSGGGMEGGILIVGHPSVDSESGEEIRSTDASSIFNEFSLTRSATLHLSVAASNTILGHVALEDGSSLLVDASSVHLVSGSFLGESHKIPVSNPSWDEETQSYIMEPGIVDDHGEQLYEPFSGESQRMQPVVTFSPLAQNISVHLGTCVHSEDATETVCMDIVGSGAVQNATINAELNVNGRIEVEDLMHLIVPQGGLLSSAHAILKGPRAAIALTGYSSRLFTYDSFELTVSHRSPVIGEYYSNNTFEFLEQQYEYDQSTTMTGVYRLEVRLASDNDHSDVYFPSSISYGVGDTGSRNVTRCIPYNATADEVKAILDQISLIQQRGGVTVRRTGDGNRGRFGFGYTYRIDMDAPPTDTFEEGAVEINLYCAGLAGTNSDSRGNSLCACAETKVALMDPTGQPQCPSSVGTFSIIDADACVLGPELEIGRISSLTQMNTDGSALQEGKGVGSDGDVDRSNTGRLSIQGGVHRLPAISSVIVEVTKGSGVVSADIIRWYGFRAGGVGSLIFSGRGWSGWDSTYLLYAPVWTEKRAILTVLNRAPAFDMSAEYFLLDGVGTVLSSCPHSNLTWNTGTWNGGIIGGRSVVLLTGTLWANGPGKSLRYGMTLFVTDQAQLIWSTGNISLADGADIIIEGSLVVYGNESAVFIGQAQLLDADTEIGLGLLDMAVARNWHDYFDQNLPAELKYGWYQNPLCGDQCLVTNELRIQANGTIETVSSTVLTLSVPLNLVGNSRLNIGESVLITLASGGICGNEVVIDIGPGTQLELSGGRMLMQSTCTIQGAGELLVTAGAHDLSFSVDAHITISGGAMIWPASRGEGLAITFNGGLLIENTGQLQVEPFSTTILVHQTVQLEDQATIQFPLIGIAAQSSPFDEQDAPDTSPRGRLTSTGTMIWNGGYLIGKADFDSLTELFLDGDVKYIKGLAKLVNKGHCEWGDGNIIVSDQGDFLNQGSIQMTRGVDAFTSNMMIQGTELPIDNGGDVFALEYHSWDMDAAALDYRAYVEYRTQFVSRAPSDYDINEQLEAMYGDA